MCATLFCLLSEVVFICVPSFFCPYLYLHVFADHISMQYSIGEMFGHKCRQKQNAIIWRRIVFTYKFYKHTHFFRIVNFKLLLKHIQVEKWL